MPYPYIIIVRVVSHFSGFLSENSSEWSFIIVRALGRFTGEADVSLPQKLFFFGFLDVFFVPTNLVASYLPILQSVPYALPTLFGGHSYLGTFILAARRASLTF